MKTQRVIAMVWWNNLSSLRKTQLCDTNTSLVGSVRRYETLTGSEIELLYKTEHLKVGQKVKCQKGIYNISYFSDKANMRNFYEVGYKIIIQEVGCYDIQEIEILENTIEIDLKQSVENYLERDYSQYMSKELLKGVILDFIKHNNVVIYQSLTNDERLDLIGITDISTGNLL